MAITPVVILDSEKIALVRAAKGAVPGAFEPDTYGVDSSRDSTAELQAAVNAIRLAGKGTLALEAKQYRCKRLDLDKQTYLVFIGEIIDPDLQIVFKFDGAKQ